MISDDPPSTSPCDHGPSRSVFSFTSTSYVLTCLASFVSSYRTHIVGTEHPCMNFTSTTLSSSSLTSNASRS